MSPQAGTCEGCMHYRYVERFEFTKPGGDMVFLYLCSDCATALDIPFALG